MTSIRNTSIQNRVSTAAGRRSRCRTWNFASSADVVIVATISLIVEI